MKDKLIEALELDKNGNWDAAHQTVQVMENRDAYWIHAYLHRKEGDLSNASYWYSRAQKPMPEYSLEQEWQKIYDTLK